jgi:hypothetical protein
MTNDRIERLREWVKIVAGSEIGYVYSDGILRALDEREALLKAAKEAALDFPTTALLAAIAKAEAP